MMLMDSSTAALAGGGFLLSSTLPLPFVGRQFDSVSIRNEGGRCRLEFDVGRGNADAPAVLRRHCRGKKKPPQTRRWKDGQSIFRFILFRKNSSCAFITFSFCTSFRIRFASSVPNKRSGGLIPMSEKISQAYWYPYPRLSPV